MPPQPAIIRQKQQRTKAIILIHTTPFQGFLDQLDYRSTPLGLSSFLSVPYWDWMRRKIGRSAGKILGFSILGLLVLVLLFSPARAQTENPFAEAKLKLEAAPGRLTLDYNLTLIGELKEAKLVVELPFFVGYQAGSATLKCGQNVGEGPTASQSEPVVYKGLKGDVLTWLYPGQLKLCPGGGRLSFKFDPCRETREKITAELSSLVETGQDQAGAASGLKSIAVKCAGDEFSLELPARLKLEPAEGGDIPLTVSSKDFDGKVKLFLPTADCPSSSAGFSVSLCLSGDQSVEIKPGERKTLNLQLWAGSSAEAKDYSLTVRGEAEKSSTVQAQATTVAQVISFSLSVEPERHPTIAAGQTGRFSLSLRPINGFDRRVSLTQKAVSPGTAGLGVAKIEPAELLLDGRSVSKADYSVPTNNQAAGQTYALMVEARSKTRLFPPHASLVSMILPVQAQPPPPPAFRIRVEHSESLLKSPPPGFAEFVAPGFRERAP